MYYGKWMNWQWQCVWPRQELLGLDQANLQSDKSKCCWLDVCQSFDQLAVSLPHTQSGAAALHHNHHLEVWVSSPEEVLSLKALKICQVSHHHAIKGNARLGHWILETAATLKLWDRGQGSSFPSKSWHWSDRYQDLWMNFSSLYKKSQMCKMKRTISPIFILKYHSCSPRQRKRKQ